MRVLRLFVSGLAALVTVSCCSSPTSPSLSGGAPLQIVVSGKSQLQITEKAPLKAVATFGDGSTKDVTSIADWTSTNAGVCSVDGKGITTGVSSGGCTVTAILRQVTGGLPINVLSDTGGPGGPGDDPNDPDDPGDDPGDDPIVRTLFVQGPTQVAIGNTVSWNAILQELDSLDIVTQQATWTSQQPNIASIAGKGEITGVAAGIATITASHNGRTATGQIQVTQGDQPAPTVTSLAITGTPCSTVGGSSQLQAIASYSNGTSQNVTNQAAWSSTQGSVATVSTGFVSCNGAGTTQISASFGGRTASVPATVTSAPVSGTITITGTSCTTAGTQAQLQAVLNGSQNVTSQANWTSSNGGVATVSGGQVSCLTAGTTTITASLPPHTPGTRQVTVTGGGGPTTPDLIGIEVRVGVDVLTGNGPLGLNLDLADLINGNPLVNLSVWGLYSDGSKQNVTQAATINCPTVPAGQVECILNVDEMGVVDVVTLLLNGLLDANHPINVTYGGYTANVVVDLSLPVLQSLGIGNGGPLSLDVGNQLPALQAVFSQGISTTLDADLPDVAYDIVLDNTSGVLGLIGAIPFVGPALTTQLNQVVDGLSVVDGVLTLVPGLTDELNGLLNNPLLSGILGGVLPLELVGTLDGVVFDEVPLNLGN